MEVDIQASIDKAHRFPIRRKSLFIDMMGCLLNSLLALLLLSSAGYKEPVIAAEQQQSVDTISGILHVFLHRRDVHGLYVRFKLIEHEADKSAITIADSGIIKISEHPIPFSLSYPPDMVKQESPYLLTVTVTDDPEGTVELTSMSAPVLTQGHPSVVNLAIQLPPEPIE